MNVEIAVARGNDRMARGQPSIIVQRSVIPHDDDDDDAFDKKSGLAGMKWGRLPSKLAA